MENGGLSSPETAVYRGMPLDPLTAGATRHRNYKQGRPGGGSGAIGAIQRSKKTVGPVAAAAPRHNHSITGVHNNPKQKSVRKATHGDHGSSMHFTAGQTCAAAPYTATTDYVAPHKDYICGDDRHLQEAALAASVYPEKRLLRALNNNVSTGSGSSTNKRKLILHFDVRNTVLVADSVWSVNVEQALNCYLSGVTWGRETPGGEWQWVSEEPSLKAPGPGLMAYYKHVERQTRSTADDRAALRRLTSDFTQPAAAGHRFLPHFRRLLEQLQWPHDEQDELLTMYGKDGKRYHYLIPAFLHLIRVLTAQRRDFAIVVRTYGMDGPQVLKAVERTVQGHHPSFPEPIPVDVHTVPGRVVRGPADAIQFERTCRPESPHAPPRTEVVGSEAAIYRLLSGVTGVTGFVDHFDYWSKKNFSHTAAKPFWIDLNDDKVQHIFFDDNIRAMEEDSIVNVRQFTDCTRCKGESLSLREWEQYEGSCLVQADLLGSVRNINYFVERISECERNYDEMLKQVKASAKSS